MKTERTYLGGDITDEVRAVMNAAMQELQQRRDHEASAGTGASPDIQPTRSST